MILTLFIQFLSGYLSVELKGNNIRRFINLCASNKINIWQVKYMQENQYNCIIKTNDIFKMLPHIRKTRTKFKIISRHGITSYTKKIKKRIYCLIIIFIWAAGIVDFSSRMWKITTVGNCTITKQQIIALLEENGIKKGDKIDSLNCSLIDNLLRENFSDFVWVSSDFTGTNLTISCKEAVVNTEKPIEKTGDIVSAKDAVITSIITRSGKALCHKGDSVKAGDVLVSAQYEIVDEYDKSVGLYNAKADADIIGYVKYDYSQKYNLIENKLCETKNKHYSIILGFGKNRLNCKFYINDYDKQKEITKYYNFNPFGLLNDSIYLGFDCKKELCDTEIKHSFEGLKDQCNADFIKFIEDLKQNGVLILSKNVIMEKVGNYVQTTGEIYGCESIIEYSQERYK